MCGIFVGLESLLCTMETPCLALSLTEVAAAEWLSIATLI